MSGFKRAGRWAALAATLALGACQNSFSGSPEGVPVVLESIDGAPAPVRTALVEELATAASERKVELVGSSTEARYRVRGYLSAETQNGETKVAYVWDVFDAQKRRAKRLAGSSPVRVPSGSISDMDKETLARLAQASMDEIAGFLSASKNAPEADIAFRTAEAPGEEPPVVAQ